MSAPMADWLPRADGAAAGRGEELRRSFEDRLERREEESAVASLVVERIERLYAAERERAAALHAFSDLPEEIRGLLARVLALPPDVQGVLALLLA